jgi:hypothetical protein
VASVLRPPLPPGGGTPVAAGGGMERHPLRFSPVRGVTLGFSRGTRMPGAAASGSKVAAAFFFAGGGRLVAGVADHEIPLPR